MKSNSHMIKSFLYFLILFGQFACIIIFFDSFFNVSNSTAVSPINNKNANNFPLERCLNGSEPPFSKLIFMVVDAMRADLFFDKPYMQFTRSKVNEETAFIAHAHPPTVTLPRLKSMLTGMMPHFLDVIFNLISIDNHDQKTSTGIVTDDATLLYRLKFVKNWKMILLGDETWTRVSPVAAAGLYFDHELSDTTNSLFVTDTVQVDTNVTRNLPKLLAEDADWNMLILHYLGLDHIGHVFGLSELSEDVVQRKLHEMDEVVKEIYNYAYRNPETLIVLCSDHGMTNTGNHGGASPEETQATLMFLSPKFDIYKSEDYFSKIRKINQIDVVPTLSMLLGVEIPPNNVGKVVESVIEKVFEIDKIICMQQENFLQLIQHLPNNANHCREEFETVKNLDSRDKELALLRLLDDLSNKLTKKKAEFNYIGICFAILGMVSSCIILFILKFWKGGSIYMRIGRNPIPMAKLLLVGLAILFTDLVLQKHFNSTVTIQWIYMLVFYPILSLNISYAITLIIWGSKSSENKKAVSNAEGTRLITYFWTMILLLHVLSLVSSSFIEEEHNTWYYYTSTLCILLLLYQFYEKRSLIFPLLILIAHNIARHWHQSGIKYQDNRNTIYNNLNNIIEANLFIKSITIAICLILIASIRIRVGKAYAVVKYSLLILSSILVFIIKIFPTLGLPIIPVYLFHLIYILISLLSINWQNNEHAAFYLIDCATPICLFWLLIEKIGNSPLIMLVLLQMYCLAHILGYCVERRNLSNMDIHAICYCFGMTIFYYFGRNISISSVDFSVAYQGLSSYQPTLIASLVFLEIYLPKIFFSIFIPIYITIKLQQYEKKFSDLPLNSIFSFIFGIHSIQLLVNSCMLYLMRDHLFIWSVFSPKFLWIVGDWLALCLLFIISSLLQVHYHVQQGCYHSEK